MQKLRSLFGTINDALDVFLHVDKTAEPGMTNSTAYADLWRDIMEKDAEAVLDMPAGLVQVVLQNAVVFAEKRENAANIFVPVACSGDTFAQVADRVRTFWVEGHEVDQAKFDMLLGLPSNRIEAIVYRVDAPGPYEVVDTIDEARLLSLPLATLGLIGNMYGMFYDWDMVSESVDEIFAEIDAGTLANDHDTIEARLKVVMDTDVLVDP